MNEIRQAIMADDFPTIVLEGTETFLNGRTFRYRMSSYLSVFIGEQTEDISLIRNPEKAFYWSALEEAGIKTYQSWNRARLQQLFREVGGQEMMRRIIQSIPDDIILRAGKNPIEWKMLALQKHS